jgi:hypothetical protein
METSQLPIKKLSNPPLNRARKDILRYMNLFVFLLGTQMLAFGSSFKGGERAGLAEWKGLSNSFQETSLAFLEGSKLLQKILFKEIF